MLLQGFANLFANPVTVALIAIGDLAGLIFGAIPGLSAFTALAIMLPLTFSMEPVVGISFLMSVYVGGVSGGFISAILLGIPGTPSSIATCFDGHALATKGQSYRAMGVAVLFSFIGGIFSAVILSTLAPLIGQVALRFSPYEYTAVILLALTTVSALAEGSMVKGLLACLLGVSLSFVGIDQLSAYNRNISHKGRQLSFAVGSHQGDLRSPEHGSLCHSNAHFSAGMVCYEPDRVNGFSGCSCSDKHLLACKILFKGDLTKDIFIKHLGLGHSAVTQIAVCQHSVLGLDQKIAKPFQLLDVVLNNGIMEHIMVHGRRDDLFAGTSHNCSGEHIISDTACYLSDHISRSRCDHDHISLFCKSNVLNAVLKVAVKGIYQALFSCETFKGYGIDELLSVFCHEYLNVCSLLF